MKLWLDDERPPPDDTWTWVRTAGEAIMFLAVHNLVTVGGRDHVTHVSFDHDLGVCNFCWRLGKKQCVHDGHSVASYIEERVACHSDYGPPYNIPRLEVHSQNPVGIQRLKSAFAAIERQVKEREGK